MDATPSAGALGYDGPLALVRLCGVPLILRTLYVLRNAGVREAIIVSGQYVMQLSSFLGRGDGLGMRFYHSPGLGEALDMAGDGYVLLIPVGLVASESFFELFTGHEGPAVAVIGGELVGAIKADVRDVRALLSRWEDDGLVGLAAPLLASGAVALDPTSIEVHEPWLRRSLRPLCVLVRDRASWAEAKKAIIFRTQKGLHFTGYVNKPVEDRIAYHISERAWVSPNAITVIANILAFAIAPLFVMGYFIHASTLAYLIGIIDGVDGKLARSRGFLTKLGHIEHSLDTLFEQTWYLCFALGLHMAYGHWWILPAGGAFLVLDTFVRHVYMQFKEATGMALTATSPLDRRFALVDGRRNMYLLYMIVFSALGLSGLPSGPFPALLYAMLAMIAHAWLTAAFYIVRACHHMRRADEESGVSAWMRLARKAP